MTETYFYSCELSQNPDNGSGTPIGRITVTLPYDGHDHFTPQAISDLRRQLRDRPPRAAADALVGYLALTNSEDQGLQELMDSGAPPHRAVPLRAPLAGDGMDAEGLLRADRHACVFEFAYTPRWPDDVIPVVVEIQPYDEDNLESLRLDTAADPDLERFQAAATEVARQVGFNHNLMLQATVILHLPKRLADEDLAPKIRQMSLEWPTVTSFHSVELAVGDTARPVRYNPTIRRLEWSDVPMTATGELAGADQATYASKMRLEIGHPGELYQQNTLNGQVEVEIPGRLLSGLDARLYDSGGKPFGGSRPRLERATRVVTDFRLYLDDTFPRRILSPSQHLHFDEVIPDDIRIADIKAALADRGFRPDRDELLPQPGGGLAHLIVVWRREGPHEMRLWLLIDGKRYQPERQTQVPGGQKFTSTVESGELNVSMRGELPGDSRRLTEEMNLLHQAIRSRFEHLRAKR